MIIVSLAWVAYHLAFQKMPPFAPINLFLRPMSFPQPPSYVEAMQNQERLEQEERSSSNHQEGAAALARYDRVSERKLMLCNAKWPDSRATLLTLLMQTEGSPTKRTKKYEKSILHFILTCHILLKK